jgi:hypothetical protein
MGLQYEIHFLTEGKLMATRKVGTWRDNAVEEYRRARHHMESLDVNATGWTMRLVDGIDNSVLYESTSK